MIIKNDSTPSTPASGYTAITVDSTTKKLTTVDDTGTATTYGSGGGGGGTSDDTNALNSATTTIDVSAATAPSSGQVLTATSSTTATWQAPTEDNTDKSFLSSAIGIVSVLITKIASQTADLFRIADESDNDLFTVDVDGTIRNKLRSSVSDGFSFAPVDGDSQIGINFSGTGSNSVITLKAGNDNAFSFSGNGLAMSGAGVYGIRSSIDGLVTSPGFTFDNDRNTGMYRIGGDNLGLAVGGTKGVDIKSDVMETSGVIKPASYATGSLPAASSYEGAIVYDSTTQTMKWSNGTVWATI